MYIARKQEFSPFVHVTCILLVVLLIFSNSSSAKSSSITANSYSEIIVSVISSPESSDIKAGQRNLNLSSKPTKCEVYINSLLIGNTPMQVSITSGLCIISFKKQGYVSAEKEIMLSEDDIYSVQAVLVKERDAKSEKDDESRKKRLLPGIIGGSALSGLLLTLALVGKKDKTQSSVSNNPPYLQPPPPSPPPSPPPPPPSDDEKSVLDQIVEYFVDLYDDVSEFVEKPYEYFSSLYDEYADDIDALYDRLDSKIFIVDDLKIDSFQSGDFLDGDIYNYFTLDWDDFYFNNLVSITQTVETYLNSDLLSYYWNVLKNPHNLLTNEFAAYSWPLSDDIERLEACYNEFFSNYMTIQDMQNSIEDQANTIIEEYSLDYLYQELTNINNFVGELTNHFEYVLDPSELKTIIADVQSELNYSYNKAENEFADVIDWGAYIYEGLEDCSISEISNYIFTFIQYTNYFKLEPLRNDIIYQSEEWVNSAIDYLTNYSLVFSDSNNSLSIERSGLLDLLGDALEETDLNLYTDAINQMSQDVWNDLNDIVGPSLFLDNDISISNIEDFIYNIYNVILPNEEAKIIDFISGLGSEISDPFSSLYEFLSGRDKTVSEFWEELIAQSGLSFLISGLEDHFEKNWIRVDNYLSDLVESVDELGRTGWQDLNDLLVNFSLYNDVVNGDIFESLSGLDITLDADGSSVSFPFGNFLSNDFFDAFSQAVSVYSNTLLYTLYSDFKQHSYDSFLDVLEWNTSALEDWLPFGYDVTQYEAELAAFYNSWGSILSNEISFVQPYYEDIVNNGNYEAYLEELTNYAYSLLGDQRVFLSDPESAIEYYAGLYDNWMDNFSADMLEEAEQIQNSIVNYIDASDVGIEALWSNITPYFLNGEILADGVLTNLREMAEFWIDFYEGELQDQYDQLLNTAAYNGFSLSDTNNQLTVDMTAVENMLSETYIYYSNIFYSYSMEDIRKDSLSWINTLWSNAEIETERLLPFGFDWDTYKTYYYDPLDTVFLGLPNQWQQLNDLVDGYIADASLEELLPASMETGDYTEVFNKLGDDILLGLGLSSSSLPASYQDLEDMIREEWELLWDQYGLSSPPDLNTIDGFFDALFSMTNDLNNALSNIEVEINEMYGEFELLYQDVEDPVMDFYTTLEMAYHEKDNLILSVDDSIEAGILSVQEKAEDFLIHANGWVQEGFLNPSVSSYNELISKAEDFIYTYETMIDEYDAAYNDLISIESYSNFKNRIDLFVSDLYSTVEENLFGDQDLTEYYSFFTNFDDSSCFIVRNIESFVVDLTEPLNESYLKVKSFYEDDLMGLDDYMFLRDEYDSFLASRFSLSSSINDVSEWILSSYSDFSNMGYSEYQNLEDWYTDLTGQVDYLAETAEQYRQLVLDYIIDDDVYLSGFYSNTTVFFTDLLGDFSTRIEEQLSNADNFLDASGITLFGSEDLISIDQELIEGYFLDPLSAKYPFLTDYEAFRAATKGTAEDIYKDITDSLTELGTAVYSNDWSGLFDFDRIFDSSKMSDIGSDLIVTYESVFLDSGFINFLETGQEDIAWFNKIEATATLFWQDLKKDYPWLEESYEEVVNIIFSNLDTQISNLLVSGEEMFDLGLQEAGRFFDSTFSSIIDDFEDHYYDGNFVYDLDSLTFIDKYQSDFIGLYNEISFLSSQYADDLATELIRLRDDYLFLTNYASLKVVAGNLIVSNEIMESLNNSISPFADEVAGILEEVDLRSDEIALALFDAGFDASLQDMISNFSLPETTSEIYSTVNDWYYGTGLGDMSIALDAFYIDFDNLFPLLNWDMLIENAELAQVGNLFETKFETISNSLSVVGNQFDFYLNDFESRYLQDTGYFVSELSNIALSLYQDRFGTLQSLILEQIDVSYIDDNFQFSIDNGSFLTGIEDQYKNIIEASDIKFEQYSNNLVILAQDILFSTINENPDLNFIMDIDTLEYSNVENSINGFIEDVSIDSAIGSLSIDSTSIRTITNSFHRVYDSLLDVSDFFGSSDSLSSFLDADVYNAVEFNNLMISLPFVDAGISSDLINIYEFSSNIFMTLDDNVSIIIDNYESLLGNLEDAESFLQNVEINIEDVSELADMISIEENSILRGVKYFLENQEYSLEIDRNLMDQLLSGENTLHWLNEASDGELQEMVNEAAAKFWGDFGLSLDEALTDTGGSSSTALVYSSGWHLLASKSASLSSRISEVEYSFDVFQNDKPFESPPAYELLGIEYRPDICVKNSVSLGPDFLYAQMDNLVSTGVYSIKGDAVYGRTLYQLVNNYGLNYLLPFSKKQIAMLNNPFAVYVIGSINSTANLTKGLEFKNSLYIYPHFDLNNTSKNIFKYFTWDNYIYQSSLEQSIVEKANFSWEAGVEFNYYLSVPDLAPNMKIYSQISYDAYSIGAELVHNSDNTLMSFDFSAKYEL